MIKETPFFTLPENQPRGLIRLRKHPFMNISQDFMLHYIFKQQNCNILVHSLKAVLLRSEHESRKAAFQSYNRDDKALSN